MKLTSLDLRYAIDERKVQMMSADHLNDFVRAYGVTGRADGKRRRGNSRAGRPRSGGRGKPCKALGIKVRWALLGFVGPFNLKKYEADAASGNDEFPTVSNDFQSIPITF